MPGQTLALTQQQQLQMVLAPQLRQSLEMLQLPILELRAMIRQEIEINPTVEEALTDAGTVELDPREVDTTDTEKDKELEFEKEYEALARLDEEWRDYFFQNIQNRPYTQEDAEKRQFLMDSLPQRESLQEHLVNQLNMADLSDADRRVGELIVGSINDDGYLTGSLDDLAQSANCDPGHLADVLCVVQDLHPVGVGARDLRECLLLQLERLSKSDSLAAAIVRDHLDALGAKKLPDIARALKVGVEDVQREAKFIATLNPRPGSAFSEETATYITPEVVVEKVEGEYVIYLNDDHLPHVRISSHYRQLLNDEKSTTEVKSYIRERIRSGAFLIKSIHQRQKTIQRIATEIVKTQPEFLEHGVSHLRPMTMADVARAVGVHETTVSRAVASKYMRTPVGIFEMRYFFTPGIKTADGQQLSNKTVKDMIATMVADEDKTSPLSDQEIVERLTSQGISIARRTIAKYRLMLRIPPSHLRKGF